VKVARRSVFGKGGSPFGNAFSRGSTVFGGNRRGTG
jgi:hypothetical protein